MKLRFTPIKANGFSVLPAQHAMLPGNYLQSPNGRFQLVLQQDGNLVIKDRGVVVWVADAKQPYSITVSDKGLGMSLQFAANVGAVLYDPSRNRVWAAQGTFTRDKAAKYNHQLSLQDDGNLVVYDQRDGRLVWARFGFVPGRAPKPIKIYQATWAWDFDIR